jgi:hypothetical protein
VDGLLYGAAFTASGGEQLPTTEFLFYLTVCEGPKPPVGVFIILNYFYTYFVVSFLPDLPYIFLPLFL